MDMLAVYMVISYLNAGGLSFAGNEIHYTDGLQTAILLLYA